MKMIKSRFPFLLILLTTIFTVGMAQQRVEKHAQRGEIIYHVFQRSFYDSNGDLHGDFKGLEQKLDYIKELGATTLLLLPVFESDFYHNYFANDFEKTDPRYGSNSDFIHLVKSVHRHGMKIYLDMETQYVTDKHIWWKDGVGNLRSPYAHYILYDDSAHLRPSSMFMGLTSITGYNKATVKATTVNLLDEGVFEYNVRLFRQYADPNRDGDFSDGVDGFRLDHTMDNLDFKRQLTDLFHRFWLPLIESLKKINPRLVFIAEQSDWSSYGFEYFKNAGLDMVFAFNLQYAIQSFNKKRIAKTADTTFNNTPSNKSQVVFIENHDMQRFATTVGKNPGKERVAAALNLLLGGTPSIYYGQELGMFGGGGYPKFGNTDGNDIPQREAFEWYKSDTGKGMAIWYKNSGPWWDHTNLKPNDGVSLEEERNDPASLFNFYKKLTRLHQSSECLYSGKYQTVFNDNDSTLSFIRYLNKKAALVIINLSGSPQQAVIDVSTIKDYWTEKPEQLLGNVRVEKTATQYIFSLQPWAVSVWR